jgi:hypothetical protein
LMPHPPSHWHWNKVFRGADHFHLVPQKIVCRLGINFPEKESGQSIFMWFSLKFKVIFWSVRKYSITCTLIHCNFLLSETFLAGWLGTQENLMMNLWDLFNLIASRRNMFYPSNHGYNQIVFNLLNQMRLVFHFTNDVE